MAIRHTPGPWKANCFLVTDANGEQICHTGGTRYRGEQPQPRESEANAKLIAAAPTLARDLEDALALLLTLREIREDGDPIDAETWLSLDEFAGRAGKTLIDAGRLP